MRLSFFIYSTILSVNLINLSIDSIAQAKAQVIDSVIFQGKIEGTKPGSDSLWVMYTPDVMCTYDESQADGATKFYVRPDKNGSFKFKLPPANKLGSISFSLMVDTNISGKSTFPLSNAVYRRFYVESNDSIFMSIKVYQGELNSTFSGRGATKYLAANSISKAMSLNPKVSIELNNPKAFQIMVKLEQTVNIRLKVENALLDFYKTELSKTIYNLIQADIYGRELSILVYELTRLALINDHDTNQALFKRFLPEINVNLSPESPYYIQYLLLREKLAFQLENGAISYSVKDICQQLKNNYSGLLRDKLLTSYLLNNQNRFGELTSDDNEYDLCLDQAFQIVRYRQFKKEIADRVSKFRQGSVAYDFILPNAKGEKVKLSDFKGKVVLIDIYATICSGCRVFSSTLKEKVFPKFKDNPDIVFIAISIEPKKEIWLKDIETGHNTSKEHEIILFTDGLGSNHPLIINYRIHAVPTIFLIDKEGKIANSSSTLHAETSGEDVVKLIMKELQKEMNKS